MNNKQEDSEEKKMMTLTPIVEKKPIPKSQVGLNIQQKNILKDMVGKISFPVDLNVVREWDEDGKN